jgi:hypothetical protein
MKISEIVNAHIKKSQSETELQYYNRKYEELKTERELLIATIKQLTIDNEKISVELLKTQQQLNNNTVPSKKL